MGRPTLTPDDHAAFRKAMREVATRRFANHGEAGVTMRALAEDLACSPMTPYRYFRDKDEILGMVRAAASEAFAVSQERAFASEPDPVRRLHALARAYVAHALAYPDQYRVMFQLEHHRGREHVDLDLRGWLPMRTTVAEAVARNMIAGDPDELAHVCWAAVHGLVTLHLAGKLRLGRDLASLITPTIELLIQPPRRSDEPPVSLPRVRRRVRANVRRR